jgi:hypothetical protein
MSIIISNIIIMIIMSIIIRYAPAQPSASTGLRFAPSEARPISWSEFGTTPTFHMHYNAACRTKEQ